ncbi:MAG: CHAT domain-containing tetratricopeptide repeat protein, partial [Acidobacteriota bacterium]
ARALELDFIEEDCGRALVHYENAARLWGQAGRFRDVALVLLELGDCRTELGVVGQAHRDFLRALALSKEVSDPVTELQALKSLGYTTRSLGQLNQALVYIHQALDLARRAGQPNHVADSLNNLCSARAQLGRYDSALEACSEALDLYEELGWKRSRVRTLGHVASIHRRRSEWSKAAEIYEEAMTLGVDEMRLISTLKARKASVMVAMGRPTEALALLESALEEFIELGELGSQADARASLALLLFDLGRGERAGREASEALEVLSQLDNVVSELFILSRLARFHLKAGRPELAAELGDRGFASLEKVRRTPPEFEDRIRFFASGWALHDVRVTARMELFRQTGEEQWRDAALFTAEEGRALGLIDLLDGFVPEDAQADAPSPSERYRSVLDASAGLLHFHLGKGQSFLWRWVDGRVEAFPLPPASEIAQLAESFRKHLTARDDPRSGESPRARAGRIREADQSAAQAARELSTMLRLPEAVSGQDVERWVIIPDGALHGVPFAALGRRRGTADGEWRPLLEDFEVVYAPSASSLGALRKLAQRTVSRDFLAVADPVFDAADPRNGGKAKPGPTAQSLARLPLTRDEAQGIASMAPAGAVVLMDHSANKERLFEESLKDVGFLHFATHGLIDPEHPGQSALVLSHFDRDGRPLEAFLSVSELQRLRLDAQLVVLSACHSAAGEEVRGEGLLGLARGFMNAGVPRVVASQWAIQDGVAQELMKSFYRKIWVEGQRPAAALREAQLEQRRRGLGPYHWAAFSFQGDWR